MEKETERNKCTKPEERKNGGGREEKMEKKNMKNQRTKHRCVNELIDI